MEDAEGGHKGSNGGGPWMFFFARQAIEHVQGTFLDRERQSRIYVLHTVYKYSMYSVG